jgi:thiol:disulfide interchange protein DsbD
VTNPHVTIWLVPSALPAAPGRALPIALYFEVEPGWHIYWKNPGDGGIAPRMTWALPGGWSVDTLTWPVPEWYEVVGIVSHIHRGRLALGTTLQVPPTAVRSAPVGVDLLYGICREVCLPGRASLRLDLPLGPLPETTSEWSKLQSLMAARAPRTGGPAVSARLADSTVWLTVRSRSGPLESRSWTFFPADRPVAPTAVSATAPAGAGEIVMQIKLADCTPLRLNGILVPGNAAVASPVGYPISVPVRGGRAAC